MKRECISICTEEENDIGTADWMVANEQRFMYYMSVCAGRARANESDTFENHEPWAHFYFPMRTYAQWFIECASIIGSESFTRPIDLEFFVGRSLLEKNYQRQNGFFFL